MKVSSATRQDEFPRTYRSLGPVNRSYQASKHEFTIYKQESQIGPSQKGAALRNRGDKLRSAARTLHSDRTRRLRICTIRRTVYRRYTESIISTEKLQRGLQIYSTLLDCTTDIHGICVFTTKDDISGHLYNDRKYQHCYEKGIHLST